MSLSPLIKAPHGKGYGDAGFFECQLRRFTLIIVQ